MRVIRFPSDAPLPDQDAWAAELEAALRGKSGGPTAESWRELREDVRSLAPAMSPEFEARITGELQRRGALRRGAVEGGAPDGDQRPSNAVKGAPAGRARERRRQALARFRCAPRALASHRGSALGGAIGAAVGVVAALLLVTGPGGSGSSIVTSTQVQSGSAPSSRAGAAPSVVRSSPATVTPSPSTRAGGAVSAAPAEAAGATSSAAAPAAPAGPAAPGRVQQVSASLTLGTTPSNVQALSDQVGQLANRYGGYVQSSNVQVQQTGASEASLALRLPSARLGPELAAIGRLASVRAENQSLQDITDSYNSARRALGDAVAERQALLRALAAATSEGQIASLRERLSEARGAIARAQAAFNAVAHRASTAEVEVSILGDARAEPQGLTVHRGLRDAGRVLLVTATAILISAAVLVPLALAGMAIVGARRAVIRHRRERALDAP